METRRKIRDKTHEVFFRRNALIIIKEMMKLSPGHPSALVDEILHSIFFLGKINTPPYSPKEIVMEEDMLNMLKGRYPRPFELYSSQLPKRSPISCVLDMIVRVLGQENEDKIIKRLKQLIDQLKEGKATDLVASTICVSQKDKIPNSVRHYGVSMSTSGSIPGQVIIAASCLSVYWDSYVVDAVMTYYPQKRKKSYFARTIKLPKQIRCQAFNISTGAEMAPCRSCGNLFGLPTSKKEKNWPYGNCAEVESVSKLLQNENEVRKKVWARAKKSGGGNKRHATESTSDVLAGYLKMLKFQWDENFYTPQLKKRKGLNIKC